MIDMRLKFDVTIERMGRTLFVIPKSEWLAGYTAAELVAIQLRQLNLLGPISTSGDYAKGAVMLISETQADTAYGKLIVEEATQSPDPRE